MASPPPGYHATSPPASSMSRPRPGIALPTAGAPLSRKPSAASNLSAHPLRQSSFPPENTQDNRAYSPEDPELASADDVSDSELMGPASSISGPGNPDGFEGGPPKGLKRKRQKGEKKGRGRPSTKERNANWMRGSSASIANGPEDTKSRRGGAPSTTADGAGGANAENEAADDDSEEEITHTTGPGGRTTTQKESLYTLTTPFTRADMHADAANMALFRNTVESTFRKPGHARRFDAWRQGKLKTTEVRKVVNQTLSQSVPPNVVTTVGAFSKMFAGMLVEGARGVQAEWKAVEPQRADGSDNPAYKKLRLMQGLPETPPEQPLPTKEEDQEEDPDIQIIPPPTKSQSQTQPPLKPSPSPAPLKTSHTPTPAPATQTLRKGGLATTLSEPDRGPLTPDHLREALRRYKLRRAGGVVGFTGLSLQGRESAGVRAGGRGRGGRGLFR